MSARRIILVEDEPDMAELVAMRLRREGFAVEVVGDGATALEKVRAIANKQVHRAPHETLLVLDATTGQNGLTQAKVFAEATPLTGLVLTKLDGTSKGGIAFAIVRELDVPIQFIGTGEKIEDMAQFDAREYVDALFEEPATTRA